jgi:RHS repeat-associated protein
VTDGSGVRTINYDASGQIKDEDYVSGLLASVGIHRTYDSLQRLSGLSVPSAYSVGYSYDTASRLDTVTSGTNSATYGYVSNSPLVGSVTFKNGGTTRLTTTKVYDNLNRLTSISSAPSASSVLSSGYSYNSANQRTKLTREDNRYWDYGYDALGQVTSANKKLADATPMLGHSFGYTFDDIGNRKTATANGQTSTYSANLLNQYDSRSVPAAFDVLGEARFDSTVTLTVGTGLPQATTRQGDLFFKQVPVDNATLAVASNLKITGVKNLVGTAGEDAVTELTRLAFTPKTPEIFTHDADGNLTADAKWTYTWDGENRLLSVETQPTAVTSGLPKLRLEFAYDGLSRRIAKKVYAWNGSAWILGSSIRFIYDGWNLLGEIDDAGAAQRTSVWGLDLGGGLQNAGGVGGLLFAGLGAATHSVAYDGNGNVLGLFDQSTGVSSGTFEYGAFGELLKADGLATAAMPFRFSTKYTDSETGHLYYGYRYYNSTTGRWFSRDPQEEDGGLNLLGFVANNAVGKFDYLGRYEIDIPETRFNLSIPLLIAQADLVFRLSGKLQFQEGVSREQCPTKFPKNLRPVGRLGLTSSNDTDFLGVEGYLGVTGENLDARLGFRVGVGVPTDGPTWIPETLRRLWNANVEQGFFSHANIQAQKWLQVEIAGVQYCGCASLTANLEVERSSVRLYTTRTAALAYATVLTTEAQLSQAAEMARRLGEWLKRIYGPLQI